LSEAEQLFRRALAFTEAEYGEHHAETAITIDNLAQVLEEKGDFDEAELLFRRALAIAESTLEADNPSRAIVINNLALVLESKGQYDEAVGLYRNALAIFEAALGPEHAYTRDAEVCLIQSDAFAFEIAFSFHCLASTALHQISLLSDRLTCLFVLVQQRTLLLS